MIFSTEQLHLLKLCTFPGFSEIGFGETGFSETGFGETGSLDDVPIGQTMDLSQSGPSVHVRQTVRRIAIHYTH